MDIAIHTNTGLPNQVRYAQHLHKGIVKHGHHAIITSSPTQPADIHIVQGPHFAKKHWLNHPNTILLDRAYYQPDPEYVSLGWMRADGGRNFRIGSGRQEPVIRNQRAETGSIFLADYNGALEPADTTRPHPADKSPSEPLPAALRRHRQAIGYRTTALVTAGLMGLQIVCKDPANIMYMPNWLQVLPYADWAWHEIESGEAWEHLQHDINTRNITNSRTSHG